MKHSQNRETISAVLIVKNEEHQIERALKSLDWVDEIVVVDDGSTDQTANIARKYTSKVIPHTHTGKIADTWLAGVQAAASEWVLLMDADEEATPVFKAAALKILENGNSKYHGYMFYRNNWFLGKEMKWGGWRHQHMRFYRKKYGSFTSKLHLDIRVPGEIGHIEADIHHYPFTSIAQYIERHNFYSSLATEDIKDKFGLVSLKTLKYHLTIRPLKIFWKSYIKKRGYRDGMHGLIFAILYSFLHFLEWAKYWEKYYKDQRDSYETLSK